MNKSTGIHCKVICDDQMRRFQFSGTEFSSLQHQVNQLLGLNCEFVLKYKDNEGDMITISSTEELACAIEITEKNNPGLFRLTVFFPETSKCPISSTHIPIHPEHGRGPSHRGHGRGGKWGERGCHDGRDSSDHPCKGRYTKLWSNEGNPAPSDSERPWKGRYEKHWSHHGGPASSENPCNGRFEKKREKLIFKREMFKTCLSSLEQVKDLSPEEERKKEIFQEKVQRLDSILAQFFPPKDEADYSSEKPNSEKICPPKQKCHRKFEKKERKWEKKEHKKEKKEPKNSFLSEEAKAEITTLKSQIKELKPALWAIQEQLQIKKSAVRTALEIGEHAKIPELQNEIRKLKQEKRAKKEQIVPLCKRVHQLKCGK